MQPGKKVYTPKFLLSFQARFTERPEGMPDMIGVTKEAEAGIRAPGDVVVKELDSDVVIDAAVLGSALQANAPDQSAGIGRD